MIRPSGLLLAAVGAMSLCILAVAAAIGLGAIGELLLPSRIVIAGICSGLAFFGFFQAIFTRKTFRIDISGVGQIRLVEDNDAVGFPETEQSPDQRGSGEVVQLMSDSTIWPGLLALRFKRPDGRITSVPVLPDCLSANGFRALSVACRWIAAHNNRAEGELI